MRICNGRIENFMMIGEAEVSLDDRGLVLIQGENKDDTSQDSNGAGKSSLVDALSWCFYGFTAREETGDDVINRSAKKNCRVTFNLEDDDGAKYRISRHRKHSEFKNRLILENISGAEPKDLTLGTDKLTQEAINKIIGCSENVFKAAVYMGQEQMPDLPSMTDKFLKTLIEEAAGVDRLQAGYEIARSQQTAIKRQLEEYGNKIEAERRVVATIEASLAETKSQMDQWEKNRAANVAEKVGRAQNLKKEIDDMDPTLPAQISAIEAEIQASVELIQGFTSEKEKESQLQELVTKHASALSSAKQRLKSEGQEYERLKAHAESVESRVGQPCGECGKPHTKEDLGAAIEIAQQKVEAAKERVTAAGQLYREALFSASQSEKALSLYRVTMTDISAENERQRQCRVQLRSLQSQLSEQKDARDKLQNLVREIKALRDSENPYETLGKSNAEKLENAKTRIEELDGLIAITEDQLKIADSVVRVFGPAGVRAHILDTVTPFLNDRTAHYLNTLTDGNVSAVWQTLTPAKKDGELKEKFSITASSRVGAGRFKGLSGGEKRKVRLACAMALQDLVASRATKPIDLFIADEIDHALDAAGLERLMAILEEKSKARGTVLVISHNSLSDWIRQTVTVVKEGGRSTLKGEALSWR